MSEIMIVPLQTDLAFVGMIEDQPRHQGGQRRLCLHRASRKPRARQNVVLEAGMALARLGSERVLLIEKGTFELPSDLEGIIRLEFNTNVKEIAAKIGQRLTGAGIAIDQRKIIEASQ